MKKVVLGLMLAAIAVGGSSFTNAKKKSVTEGFFIQTASGIFIRANSANGTCFNLMSGLQCKYEVTSIGHVYIPSRAVYFTDDIQDYLDEDWIQLADGSAAGIYLIIN